MQRQMKDIFGTVNYKSIDVMAFIRLLSVHEYVFRALGYVNSLSKH